MTLKTKNQIHVFQPTLVSAIAMGPAKVVRKAESHCALTDSENPM